MKGRAWRGPTKGNAFLLTKAQHLRAIKMKLSTDAPAKVGWGTFLSTAFLLSDCLLADRASFERHLRHLVVSLGL